MTQNMQKYYGFHVALTEELPAGQIAAHPMLVRALEQQGYSLKDYSIYLHQTSLTDCAKGAMRRFKIHERIESLKIEFIVNSKQRVHEGRITFFNYHFEDGNVERILGAERAHVGTMATQLSVEYVLSRDFVRKSNSFKNYLLTVVDNSLKRSHRKVKVHVTARPSTAFRSLIYDEANASRETNLDCMFTKPITLLAPAMTEENVTVLTAPESDESVAPEDRRGGVSVLHVSDMHFGTSDNAKVWHSQLVQDLKEMECKHLDAIVISGDIATYATGEEYEAAQEFCEELCSSMSVDRSSLVIVPGNHDVSWPSSKKAYELHWADDCKLSGGDDPRVIRMGLATAVRDDRLYRQRFRAFGEFYKRVCGRDYPDEPGEQSVVTRLPEAGLVFVGLNSSYLIDHHYKVRSSINEVALAMGLKEVEGLDRYTKIAVCHHPIVSVTNDRGADRGTLERLAQAGFRVLLHGHIHKAENSVFKLDVSTSNGRFISSVGAGTFGATTKEWVPGFPLQYNLVRFKPSEAVVETRRREELNGAWKPDARWTGGPNHLPTPCYSIKW